MQETDFSTDAASNWQRHRALSRPARWLTALLPVLIIGIVAGSLSGLQWAGQRGIELGYPMPQVQIIAPIIQTFLRNQVYQFSAHASGRDLSYFWDFGDQSTDSGASVSHAYQSNNTFTITVTVTDAAGHRASQSDTLTVVPPPPQALFTYSYGYGYYVYFDASGSSADPSTSIGNYTWDFGDGSNTYTTSYPQVTYAYTNSGTYQVTLVVTDITGQVSNSYTSTVVSSQ